ncbi:hypothetical protein GTQ99_00550 [Kineococcus sp. T13]|uniref:hypothetical protein n=1 Tax=Kineococcus vitellinus TaxID=2696565 RepID=UPI001411F07E|nr:hypothetical protein [Kineococcus vitellinus]NAZ73921.1 hypothetical protein [Kineococcus vitellinus]
MEQQLSGREPRDYDRLIHLAARMRSHPQLWDVVGRYPSEKQARVVYNDARKGRTEAFAAPGFQFELRQTGHRHTVYGRYLPPKDAA